MEYNRHVTPGWAWPAPQACAAISVPALAVLSFLEMEDSMAVQPPVAPPADSPQLCIPLSADRQDRAG